MTKIYLKNPFFSIKSGIFNLFLTLQFSLIFDVFLRLKSTCCGESFVRVEGWFGNPAEVSRSMPEFLNSAAHF
jgi:hypothetical protein